MEHTDTNGLPPQQPDSEGEDANGQGSQESLPDTDPQKTPRRWCKGIEGPAAWFVAINAMLQTAISSTEISSFGIYYVAYTDYFDQTKVAVGWIKGIQSIVTSVFGMFSGAILDHYGCRCGGILSSVCQFLALGLASLAPNLVLLYLTHGVLFGIGHSLNLLSTSVVIQHHFSNNRVLGSGLGMFGMCIGALVGPVIVHHLLEAYSLRGSLLIHSAICLQAMVFAANYRQSKSKETPTEPTPKRKHGAGREILSVLKAAADFRLLRIPTFTIFCVGNTLTMMCLMTALSHIPGRAVTMGIDSGRAAYLMSCLSLGNTVCRAISMVVANHERVNTIGYYAGGCCLLGVGSIAYALSRNYTGLLVAVVIIGAGFAGSMTVLVAVLVELTTVEKLPKAMALYQLLSIVGWGGGAPLAGWIYDVTGNYDLPFYISGTAGLIAAPTFAVVALLEHRRKSKQSRMGNLQEQARLRALELRTGTRKDSPIYFSSMDL